MPVRWVQRVGPLLAVVAFVIGVATLSLFVRPPIHAVPLHRIRLRSARPSRSPVPAVSAPPVAPGHQSSISIIAIVITLVFLVAVLIGIGLLVKLMLENSRLRRLLFRRLTGDPTIDSTADPSAEVLAAVDAGIAELAGDDSDPRAAVIACWVRLETVAAAAGVPRQPGETPSDLVAHLLRSSQVSADALTSLAELYRSARYSTHVIESSMRDQARVALGRLRTEIKPRETSPETPPASMERG